MEVQSSKVKSSCFKKFQAFETIVPIAWNSSFYCLKLWFHTLETFGFKPLELWFLTDETTVSHRWNPSFKQWKLIKLQRVAVAWRQILPSHCCHSLPSPYLYLKINLLHLKQWQVTDNICFYLYRMKKI